MTRSLATNIRCYPWFQAASSLLGWLPVFFLYFNQFVSLAEVIQLSALYYFSVCICEVPSGYFSDRVGRRLTLLLAGTGFVVAYCAFIFASGFLLLAIGQFFLAFGIAMMSGTDTAFLYDSLLALEKQEQYADIEARGQKYGFAALSIACLAGGISGMIDLRLPYLLSLIGAIWMIWLAWHFTEPQHTAHSVIDAIATPSAAAPPKKAPSLSMVASIRQCLSLLKDKVLAWLFGVMALMYCLEHMAYEFYQPYIRLLEIDWLKGDSSPLVSGIIIAISMFGGSFGAAYSVRLYDRFGVKALLYIAFAMQLLIVAGLSLTLAHLMLGLVIFRNFPMAMIHAPVNATIAPRVSSAIRATYLSVQSLSARLVFSVVLLVLSQSVAVGESLDWNSLSTVLVRALIFGLIGTVIAILLAPAIAKRRSSDTAQSNNND